MAAIIGGIGAAVSGVSALSGLFGGGPQQPAAPPPAYTPQYLPTADQGAINTAGSLGASNLGGQNLGQYQSILQSLISNPYASQYLSGASGVAPLATGAGGQQYGAGSNLINAGQSYLPYAQQTLQTGFDPQQALYNQQFQLNTDQTRAGEAARGIAMSPYGAGIENQSNQLFNSNWQNQQLARQGQAATTAQTLTGAANNALTTGTAGQTSGLNTLLQGISLPYSTANTIGQNQLQALLGGATYGNTSTTIPQQQIADYLQYLGIGNQSSAVNNQNYANQITAQNNAFNQQQTLGKNLGASLSGLGTYFGTNSYGGGSPLTGDAYGGSASNPLAGLTAADYG